MSDDTPTAVLTNPQREYLRGERDPAQERTMRTRIRERVRAGLGDLALIATSLSEEDLDLIFEDFETWVDHERELTERDDDEDRVLHGRAKPDGLDEGRLMTRHLHGVAAFLYLALAKHGGELKYFENVVETAIGRLETTPAERAVVDVDVTIDREPRPTELLEKFERGEDLSEEELNTLVDAGEVSLVDLLEYQDAELLE